MGEANFYYFTCLNVPLRCSHSKIINIVKATKTLTENGD